LAHGSSRRAGQQGGEPAQPGIRGPGAAYDGEDVAVDGRSQGAQGDSGRNVQGAELRDQRDAAARRDQGELRGAC
jgi:hypothetical protein